MSVYKEGYYAIQLIQQRSRQIYPDAADYGAPTKQGDDLWMWVKQAIDWYGVKGSRQQTNYSTGATVSHVISLIDEWNGGYEDQFRITYTTTRNNESHDGYFTVERVRR